MSKRLQVLVDARELREFQRLARRKKVTVAEWVRQALRSARDDEPSREAARKLDAVQAANRHAFPTAEIDQMLREIETGYGGEPPR